MNACDRLAAADEANLVLDHAGQVNVFLAAGLLSLEGFIHRDGKADLAGLRNQIRSRMTYIPELHRIPQPHRRHHDWVDVEPDLDVLIRLADRIDTLSELEQRCAELMTVPLPLDRPLWELLVLPWPSAATDAFILRVHHVIADGAAAVRIVERLMGAQSASPSGDSRADEPPTHPDSSTTHVPRRTMLARFVYGARRVLVTLAARPVAKTSLLGPRSDRRGVRFMDVDLTALAHATHGRAATVNDALLSAASAGFRALLESIGDPIPESLPVSVPVALRRHGSSRNQVGVMLVELPLRMRGAAALENVRSQTQREKPRARDQGTLELMRGPFGAKLMDHVAHGQHVVAGFVTDVPGPRQPMELAGARVLRVWPVPVLAANVRLGIAAVSYKDRLYCTIHFDAEHLDGSVFADAMHAAFAELSHHDRHPSSTARGRRSSDA